MKVTAEDFQDWVATTPLEMSMPAEDTAELIEAFKMFFAENFQPSEYSVKDILQAVDMTLRERRLDHVALDEQIEKELDEREKEAEREEKEAA